MSSDVKAKIHACKAKIHAWVQGRKRESYCEIVASGIDHVVGIVTMLPWCMLALSAAYLLAGKADWSMALVAVPSAAFLIWLYRFVWQEIRRRHGLVFLRRDPRTYEERAVWMLFVIQLLSPVAALVLGVFIYRDLVSRGP